VTPSGTVLIFKVCTRRCNHTGSDIASVLQGTYLTVEDDNYLTDLPPLFAIVYWSNALSSGLFFHAPESKLRPLVDNVYKHLDGGSGTVMMFYSGFLLSWFTIMYDARIDVDVVARTKEKLLAFKHSK
jgi:hypothetical protein